MTEPAPPTQDWYVDESDPEHPFGWTDDGQTFAVYRRGIQWHAVTSRRRWWWERRIKPFLEGAAILVGLFAWAAAVGALRSHHHIFYATALGTGPILWAWGFYYGKTRR